MAADAATTPAAPPTRRQLVRDGSVTLIGRFVSLLGALVLSTVTARLLGATGRGIYAIPTIDVGIAASFFGGLTTTMTYFLSRKAAGRGAVRAVLAAGGVFVLVALGAVVALGILGHHTWATLPAALVLPLAAFNSIAVGFAYGTKRIRLSTILGIIGVGSTLVLTLGGFWLMGSTPSVAIAGWVGSQFITAAIGVFLLVRIGRTLPEGHVRPFEAVRFSLRIGAVNVVTLLNYRADVYIVALFTPPNILGMYTLAVAGAEAALTATQTISYITAPHIGSLPTAASQTLTATAARNNFFLACIACLIMGAIAPLLVHVLFGANFASVAQTLRILLIGIVAMSAAGVFSTYFTLHRGKPEVPLCVAGLSAAICIIVSVVLVPRMGMNGAAWATASSYAISALVMMIMFKRDSHFRFREIVLINAGDLEHYVAIGRRIVQYVRSRRRT